MKFDMGSTTLSELGKSTVGSSEDLGTLITWLIQSAEPLEGKFNGAGKAAFDRFKLHADEITDALNSSLGAILGGVSPAWTPHSGPVTWSWKTTPTRTWVPPTSMRPASAAR
ncbi:hypothetical protein SVIOM74S_08238 [Streptomyces violarus]